MRHETTNQTTNADATEHAPNMRPNHAIQSAGFKIMDFIQSVERPTGKHQTCQRNAISNLRLQTPPGARGTMLATID